MPSRMSRDAPIAALTPLPRIRDDLSSVAVPVAPRSLPTAEALGATLADDLRVETAVPATPVARIAGFAVAALDTVGASPYAPAMPSRLVPVDAGAALPAGCDAVLPADAVGRDIGFATVQQAVAPGENVRRAGEDFAGGLRLAAAGTRLDPRLALILALLGRDRVAVRRPRLVLRHGGDAIAAEAARFLAAAFADGRVDATLGRLADPIADADLVLLVGGAEIAPDDAALAVLDATGRRLGHGAALTGVESLAWGTIADRPALVLPCRPEAIVAVTPSLIEPLVAASAGATDAPATETRPLARKLVSQVGMSEIALLARDGDGWRPLATGDLPWWAIAAADAFVELAPACEGHGEATPLTARLLPSPGFRSRS